MNLTDTHSHIYLPEFDKDRLEIIERAEKEGVRKILLPAIDSSTHDSMLRVTGNFPEICLPMMGVHPCSVTDNFQEELKKAGEYLEKGKYIAVGEIGLDFYWEKAYTGQQYVAFHQQIEWALQYDLPVVIHSRNSIDDCIKVVSEHQKGNLKGVFHCFSGSIEQARKITALGFYLGIGGVVTFKNAGLDKVVVDISLEQILLETDAPYLAPVPYRGKRNEPAYLKYIIDKIAAIKKIPVEKIAEMTTANAKKLFGC